jgi:hypothetical protein
MHMLKVNDFISLERILEIRSWESTLSLSNILIPNNQKLYNTATHLHQHFQCTFFFQSLSLDRKKKKGEGRWRSGILTYSAIIWTYKAPTLEIEGVTGV